MVQSSSAGRRESQNGAGESSAHGQGRRSTGRKRVSDAMFQRQDPEQKKMIGMKYREMQERVDGRYRKPRP